MEEQKRWRFLQGCRPARAAMVRRITSARASRRRWRSAFVAGAFLAYLGDPLVDRLETWKISRTLSVVIVFFIILLLLLPILFYLIPLIESQIKLLIAKTPGYIDWLMVNLEPTLQDTFGFNIPALEI